MGKEIKTRFAIDLLWVRPNKVGGTEYYIRNILNGFMQLEDNFEVLLLLAKDNVDSFDHYFSDARFKRIICDINSANIIKRILWQNINLNKCLKREGINICFEPVYSKPFFTSKRVKFITTIHDLQALHYPEYQSRIKVHWLKLSWKNSIKTSDRIIAISEFVKEDIIKRYKIEPEKILTIYNAVDLEISDIADFDEIGKKYQIEKDEFYYTVSSLLPHKNLITIVKVIKTIKDQKIRLPMKLLISGINGRDRERLFTYIQENELEENIIFTGFISNSERNSLYKNCRAFLFSSIFEGFGMPPIEAMRFGANVITTRMASLYEITRGKAIYVDEPFDIEEWLKALVNTKENHYNDNDLTQYKPKVVASKLLECIKEI